MTAVKLKNMLVIPGIRMCFFFLCLLLFICVSNESCFAQEESEYDEVSVFMYIPQMGVFDVPAYIRDQELFLPVIDIFNFLKIANTPSPSYDTITGFFINPEAEYLIDRSNNRISYKGKTFDLKPASLIRTESSLYLRAIYFGQIFGLDCIFDFHGLSVIMKTDLELPVIRELKQEQMRKNISRIKGDIKADTSISRNYPAFHMGMADWAFNSMQETGGKTFYRFDLGLGAIIAGGEANIALNYNSNTVFNEKQQNYYWHFVNNNFKYLRQVTLGKISTPNYTSLNGPVVGFQFSNTPTTYRRSFCSYTLSDYTSPGWIVELYVKNVLVDYVKADASGFFSFDVPLVYGNTSVKLRFYGPWGEERTRELNINIPFNFVPPKVFEYTLTGGIVEDSRSTKFSRFNFNYGVSKKITVGGGLEYSSALTSTPVMPFANLSVRLASNLLLSGDYLYGVRGRGVLNYLSKSGMSLELNYSKYQKGQTVMITSYLEDRKIAVSLPVKIKKSPLYLRMTLDQFILPLSEYIYSEFLVSGNVLGVSTNLTSYAMISKSNGVNLNTILSLNYRFPLGFILTVQSQYDYKASRFTYVKTGLEKNLFIHGVGSMSWEENLSGKSRSFQFGLRYDFPFMQTAANAIIGNKMQSFIEAAKGSIMLDTKSHYIGATSMYNVGKGGFVVIPFLDMNCNGKRDPDEPKVSGVNLKLTGGRMVTDVRDSIIRVFDLQPFTSYFLEFDGNSFPNVAWQLRFHSISAMTNPNQFRLIEVPVSVVGEASGMVYTENNDSQNGIGRIIVSFYNEKNERVGRVLSEVDGYFSFLGLPPGTFKVMLDQDQLKKLKLKVTPESRLITIKKSSEGDMAGDMEFILRPVE